MALELNGLTAQDKLAQIAKMAYGSGSGEGCAGGAGNIGLLNGRVVKFNTHFSERLFGSTTDAMRASCNSLRATLVGLAEELLRVDTEDNMEVAHRKERLVASVCRDLGLDPESHEPVSTRLLDRTVVARVVKKISRAAELGTWRGLDADELRGLSSKGLDTHFTTVDYLASVPEIVNAAADSLVHPADGLPGVTLTADERAFLADLIGRDLAAKHAAGQPLPSREALDASLRDFTSLQLIATLQTFNKASILLQAVRPVVSRVSLTGIYLTGAPADERLDRAQLLAMLGNVPGSEDGTVGWAAALFCEKLPAMRALQAEGPLTPETVWRACFNAPAPKYEPGSRALAEAFLARMKQLITDMRRAINPQQTAAVGLDTFMTLNGTGIYGGKSVSAIVRGGMNDPSFTFDAARDQIAHASLYVVEDALAKSDEDLRKQLALDVCRQDLVVRFKADDGTVETLDLRGALSEEGEEVAQRLMDRVDAFLGKNATRAQRNVVLLGFCQAAFSPFTTVGGVGAEHSSAVIELSRVPEGNGCVELAYAGSKDCPINAAYGFYVEADGANEASEVFSVALRPLDERTRIENGKPQAAALFKDLAANLFDAAAARANEALQWQEPGVQRFFDTLVAKQRAQVIKGAQKLLVGAWAAETEPAGKAEIEARVRAILEARIAKIFTNARENTQEAALELLAKEVGGLKAENAEKRTVSAALRALPQDRILAFVADPETLSAKVKAFAEETLKKELA